MEHCKVFVCISGESRVMMDNSRMVKFFFPVLISTPTIEWQISSFLSIYLSIYSISFTTIAKHVWTTIIRRS